MGVDKLSLTKPKKKTIFGRLTNKFLQQHHQTCSKRDQSVQTSLNYSQASSPVSQLTATVLVNSRSRERTCSPSNSSRHNSIADTPHRSRRQRRRSSLKTFIISHSPKPIPLIHRTRRRSVDLKTPKRLSSECLVCPNDRWGENSFVYIPILSSQQVALIRKIQPVHRYGSPLALSSTTSNVISVTRQRQFYSSPNSMSSGRDSWNYFQNPSISHYTYLKEQLPHHPDLFQDETASREELFSIGPMKWR